MALQIPLRVFNTHIFQRLWVLRLCYPVRYFEAFRTLFLNQAMELLL